MFLVFKIQVSWFEQKRFDGSLRQQQEALKLGKGHLAEGSMVLPWLDNSWLAEQWIKFGKYIVCPHCCSCVLVCAHMFLCQQAYCLHQHLTAEVQHSHTGATPLCCCLFSATHWPVPLGRLYVCCKIWFESTIMTHGPPVALCLAYWCKTPDWGCVFVCGENDEVLHSAGACSR